MGLKSYPLDFLFADHLFKEVIINRTVFRRLGSVDVRVASLEDLILLTLPSARWKDREVGRAI